MGLGMKTRPGTGEAGGAVVREGGWRGPESRTEGASRVSL